VIKRFLTALIFLTLAAQCVLAQHTPPSPAQMVANKVSRLTTLLTLNPTQVADATMIFTTEQTAVTSIPASMRTARKALQTAVLANDVAGISTAAGTIGSLTTQEVTAQATANGAFYAILNPTQQAQYSKLGGPGGHGGGRGGFEQRGPRN
jgi:Spy/CpxP family protein refolding chaperone